MTEANARLSELENQFDQFQNLFSTIHSSEHTSQTFLIIVFHEESLLGDVSDLRWEWPHTLLCEASDFYSRTTAIADHEDRARATGAIAAAENK